MKYYQEVQLLLDEDMSPNFLWSKIYPVLHVAFVEFKDENEKIPFGVAFPEYIVGSKDKSVGTKLRVFAVDRELLGRLNLKDRLERFADYLYVTGVRAVPNSVNGYVIFARMRKETNPLAKARRYAMRHGITVEEALELFSKTPELKLPYIILGSQSTGEKFSLFVDRREVSEPCEGKFTTYGLSDMVTVPNFN